MNFGDKIKYRTRTSQFNLEDFLEEYRDNRSFIPSKRIFLNEFSIKGNPIYKFREDLRKIEIDVNYSPIERKLDQDLYIVKESKTTNLQFVIDSKQGLFFKQYILTRLELK
jgi:hypothetical protein